MSDSDQYIWEVWYTIRNCDNVYLSTGQVNVAARTIEEAIARVQGEDPNEQRLVYKVDEKGRILR